MLLRRPTESVCKILSPSNISVIHLRLLPVSDVDSYRCRTLRLYLDAPSSPESHRIVPRARCRLHGSSAIKSGANCGYRSVVCDLWTLVSEG